MKILTDRKTLLKQLLYAAGFASIAVLAAGLFMVNRASADIWADEACTLATVGKTFKEITYATAIDVHPPLYYYIVKFLYDILGVDSTNITGMIIVGRIISLMPLVVIFAACIFISAKTRNAIFLIYPFLLCQYRSVITFSCEVRMYSWTLLFLAVVAVALLHVNNTRGGVLVECIDTIFLMRVLYALFCSTAGIDNVGYSRSNPYHR